MSTDRERCLEAALRRAAAASSPMEPAQLPVEATAPASLPVEATAPAPPPEEATAPAPLPEEATAPAPLPEEATAPAPLPEEATAPASLPVEATAPVQPPAVPSIVYQASVSQPPNIQMLCVNPQDLFLLMQQMTASFFANRSTVMRPALPEVPPSPSTSGQEVFPLSAASTSTTLPVVPAPGSTQVVPTPASVATTGVEAPDVIIMESPPPSSTPGDRSPSPDFSWMFDEDPPIVVESVKSPSPYRKKYFNYDKASTSSSSKYSRYDKPCETFRRKSRSPSPPSRSPSSRYNHCGARRKERSPSPLNFRRSNFSLSPTNRRSGTEDNKTSSRRPRAPSPTFLGSSSPENKASTSSSLNRRSGTEDYKSSRRPRTPSPTFLGSSSPGNKASTSNLNRRSGTQDYKRSSRRPRTPSPSFPGTSYADKKKSRHSAPEFHDFEPHARTRSPTSSFLDDQSSSATSLLRNKLRKSPGRKKSRSPTPDFLRDFDPNERSLSPTFSFLGKKTKSSTSQQFDGTNEDERSLSPDFETQRKKKPEKECDPDYKPCVPLTPPPARKRGRPRKNTAAKTKTPKAFVLCPICKDDEAGIWVNTKCGHFFHKDCLQRWLNAPGQRDRPAYAKICPACGQDFDPSDNNPIFFG